MDIIAPLNIPLDNPEYLSIPLHGIDRPSSQVTLHQNLPYKITHWDGATAYAQQCTSGEMMAIFEWNRSQQEGRPMSAWTGQWEREFFTEWYERFQGMGVDDSLTPDQTSFITSVRQIVRAAREMPPRRYSDLNERMIGVIYKNPDWLQALSERYPE